MARTSMKNSRHRRNHIEFEGRGGLAAFVANRCVMTGQLTDVIRRRDLYHAYRTFCAARRHPVASVVNMGRYLGSLQIWASTRLGGTNGRRQEYAYVGLRLVNNESGSFTQEHTSSVSASVSMIPVSWIPVSVSTLNSSVSSLFPATVSTLSSSLSNTTQEPLPLQSSSTPNVHSYSASTSSTMLSSPHNALKHTSLQAPSTTQTVQTPQSHSASEESQHQRNSSSLLLHLKQEQLENASFCPISSPNQQQLQQTLASPLILPSKLSYVQQASVPSSSKNSKPQSLQNSTTQSGQEQAKDCKDMLQSFLQRHVEVTGYADDSVAVNELQAAYRRACKKRGLKPITNTTLTHHLTTQGISVSRKTFLSVKKAFTGLRWKPAARKALTPPPTPTLPPWCSCWSGLQDDDSFPWVREQGPRVQITPMFSDEDDDTKELLLDPLRSSPSLPSPTPVETPCSHDMIFTSDLEHMLGAHTEVVDLHQKWRSSTDVDLHEH